MLRLDPHRKIENRSEAGYLEHIGDLEDIDLAEQRLTDLRAGRTKAIPLEDVIKAHDFKPSTVDRKRPTFPSSPSPASSRGSSW